MYKRQVVCLGERECSVQRRNQKLIEEAPANRFSPETRTKMSQIICEALKKIGYYNAGTMEFLASADEKLYFCLLYTSRCV